MVLGHEKLDVYRLSIRYVAWVYEKCAKLNGVHADTAACQVVTASEKVWIKKKAGSGKMNWTASLQCLVDWAEEVIALKKS